MDHSMAKPRGCSHSQGFTLLEMTIVLVIMGVVAISLVALFSATLQKIQFRQSVAKMEAIQKALYEYRLAFNRLPCPADATLAINQVNFGYEAANPGSCTGGAPTSNFSQTPSLGPQDAREGMLPVKTIGLPDDYAFDGWGRRFIYAVSRDMTLPGAFAVSSTYDVSTRMTILNAEGVVKSTIACQVLVSLGLNGQGAYPRNGGTTRLNVSSTNISELNNCDCDSTGVSTGFEGTFVQKDITLNASDATDSFDDLLTFSARGNYLLPSSIMAQPFNLNAAGAGAGTVGGNVGGAPGLSGGGYCSGGNPTCTINAGIKRCLCAM